MVLNLLIKINRVITKLVFQDKGAGGDVMSRWMDHNG